MRKSKGVLSIFSFIFKIDYNVTFKFGGRGFKVLFLNKKFQKTILVFFVWSSKDGDKNLVEIEYSSLKIINIIFLLCLTLKVVPSWLGFFE